MAFLRLYVEEPEGRRDLLGDCRCRYTPRTDGFSELGGPWWAREI